MNGPFQGGGGGGGGGRVGHQAPAPHPWVGTGGGGGAGQPRNVNNVGGYAAGGGGAGGGGVGKQKAQQGPVPQQQPQPHPQPPPLPGVGPGGAPPGVSQQSPTAGGSAAAVADAFVPPGGPGGLPHQQGGHQFVGYGNMNAPGPRGGVPVGVGVGPPPQRLHQQQNFPAGQGQPPPPAGPGPVPGGQQQMQHLASQRQHHGQGPAVPAVMGPPGVGAVGLPPPGPVSPNMNVQQQQQQRGNMMHMQQQTAGVAAVQPGGGGPRMVAAGGGNVVVDLSGSPGNANPPPPGGASTTTGGKSADAGAGGGGNNNNDNDNIEAEAAGNNKPHYVVSHKSYSQCWSKLRHVSADECEAAPLAREFGCEVIQLRSKRGGVGGGGAWVAKVNGNVVGEKHTIGTYGTKEEAVKRSVCAAMVMKELGVDVVRTTGGNSSRPKQPGAAASGGGASRGEGDTGPGAVAIAGGRGGSSPGAIGGRTGIPAVVGARAAAAYATGREGSGSAPSQLLSAARQQRPPLQLVPQSPPAVAGDSPAGAGNPLLGSGGSLTGPAAASPTNDRFHPHSPVAQPQILSPGHQGGLPPSPATSMPAMQMQMQIQQATTQMQQHSPPQLANFATTSPSSSSPQKPSPQNNPQQQQQFDAALYASRMHGKRLEEEARAAARLAAASAAASSSSGGGGASAGVVIPATTTTTTNVAPTPTLPTSVRGQHRPPAVGAAAAPRRQPPPPPPQRGPFVPTTAASASAATSTTPPGPLLVLNHGKRAVVDAAVNNPRAMVLGGDDDGDDHGRGQDDLEHPEDGSEGRGVEDCSDDEDDVEGGGSSLVACGVEEGGDGDDDPSSSSTGRRRRKPRACIMEDPDTGKTLKFFPGISEAALATKIKSTKIRKACDEGGGVVKGARFKYADSTKEGSVRLDSSGDNVPIGSNSKRDKNLSETSSPSLSSAKTKKTKGGPQVSTKAKAVLSKRKYKKRQLPLSSKGFNVAKLLPLTGNDESKRRKIVELVEKGSNQVLVCFRGVEHASVALGIDKKRAGEACRKYGKSEKDFFPSFTLRYLPRGSSPTAYEYGKHPEDYVQINETREERMARWNLTLEEERVKGSSENDADRSEPTSVTEPLFQKKSVATSIATPQQPSSNDRDFSCLICQSRRATVVFEPCHHCVLCSVCAVSGHCRRFCPSCRTAISKRSEPTLAEMIRPRIYSSYTFM